MSATITLDDYLHRNYENERECEYVDGVLEERTGGEMPHGRLHVIAASWFWEHRREWEIECYMSYSMWCSPTRIRVPDIVVTSDRLHETIRVTPPLLCVEILAPEDFPTHILRRLDDMLTMGAQYIWLLDPIECTAYTNSAQDLSRVEADRLKIPGSPIWLDLPCIFSELK